MKKKNILLGKAVSTPLCVLPAGKKSAFGIVVADNRELDRVTVRFEDGTTEVWESGHLETLYPDKALLYGLGLRNRHLDRTDYKTIRKVISLSLQGKGMEALKLAYSDTKIEEFCITTTDNYYDMRTNLRKHVGVSKRS